jgi:hypothetical protein
MGRSAAALNWRNSGQTGVAAISVTIRLPIEIALIPKKSLIEVFALDGFR